jgi:hypothetical protein
VEGFFFGPHDAAWKELKYAAEEAGYTVVLREIDIANLEMPMSRPRYFFAFIRNDVGWSLTEFEQNMKVLVRAEREAHFELDQTHINSKAQLRMFKVSNWQQANRAKGIGALNPREKALVEGIQKTLAEKKRREKEQGKRAKKSKSRGGLSVADVSKSGVGKLKSGKQGWDALHHCVDEFPTATASNCRKMFVIGGGWNCLAYPQELGLALGFEAAPLQAMCTALQTESLTGLRKLCGILGRSASPVAWRVWIGSWVNTLRDVFSCNARPGTSVVEAHECEAPPDLQEQEGCFDEPVVDPLECFDEPVVGSPAEASPVGAVASYVTPQQPTAKMVAAATDQGLCVVGAKVKCWYRGSVGTGKAYVVTITKVTSKGLTVRYSNGSIEHSVNRKRVMPRITSVLAPVGSSVGAGPVDAVVPLFALSGGDGDGGDGGDDDDGGDDGDDGNGVEAQWRDEIHMTRGASSFVGCGGDLWLSILESEGFGAGGVESVERPVGVECPGGGDERSQHRDRQQKHDKRVAGECGYKFKVLHKREHRGPTQFKGAWSEGQNGIVDGSIYFTSTPADGFKEGDVVAQHKVGLPIAELCTSTNAARSGFPWLQHWMSGPGGYWPCKRMSFWIAADGKECKNSWQDPGIATVKALVDRTIELMPELGADFGGQNLTAQVHLYRHEEHITMHRDSSRKSTLDKGMSIVHIYVSGEGCVTMSIDKPGTHTIAYGVHPGGVTTMKPGCDEAVFHSRTNVGLGEQEVAMSVILRHYTGAIDNLYARDSMQFRYNSAVGPYLDWANPVSSKVLTGRSIMGCLRKDMSVQAIMRVNADFDSKCMLRHDEASDCFKPGDVFRSVSVLPLLSFEHSGKGAVKGSAKVGGAMSIFCNAQSKYTTAAWSFARDIAKSTMQMSVNAHNINAHNWMQQSLASKHKVRLYGKLANWQDKKDVVGYLADATVVENVEGIAEPNAKWWWKLEFEVDCPEQLEVLRAWWQGHECHVNLRVARI